MSEPGGPGRGAGEFGPESYRSWRATDIGTITEELEYRLIRRLVGPLLGRAVLDVGCGDGTLTRVFSGAGAFPVIGCDVDRRMVERAAARAPKQEAPLGYLMAGADMLPFANASFDIVTVITVLAFVQNPLAALREMARVLRPGGRLVIGDLGKWSQWAAARRLRAWREGGMWQAATFRSLAEWRSLVSGAGLAIEQVKGAIYYPRYPLLARTMAPLDPLLGELTTVGAAFLAIQALKP